MDGPVRRTCCRRDRALASTLSVILFGLAVSQSAIAAPPPDYELANEIIKRAGLQRGVCAVIGRDRKVALELARASELLVHVREPDAAAVADLRRQADSYGFGIDRVAVEQGPLDRLPYADNMLDLLVATQVTEQLLNDLPVEEVLRVLRPEGTAILGKSNPVEESDVSLDALKKWAQAGGVDGVETWEVWNGKWVRIGKPAPKGTDDWSHWEKGPDNNPVSTDTVIKAPYLTQFLEHPMYIGMPAITTAAGGRTFLAIGHIAHHRREWDMLNKLIARNGYNGTILWERGLPDQYVVHRSAFYATKDTFHMIDGDRLLLLDAETGAEKGEIRIPGLEGGEWKWMAVKDGVLYVLAGKKGPGAITIKGDRTFGGWSWADLSVGYYQQPRVPWGFGNTVAAYSIQDKSLLWRHEEQTPIDSRAMAVGQKTVFL